MDLREIQRLHAQFAPDSMTIDLPRQIAALPAPTDLASESTSTNLSARLAKITPVIRRGVIAAAIAAFVGMAGMGAATLYRSIGVGAGPQKPVGKVVEKHNAQAVQSAATSEPDLRTIDAAPARPVAAAPILSASDFTGTASVGLTADQFRNSLSVRATGNPSNASDVKPAPAVSNEAQRAAVSPIRQLRRAPENSQAAAAPQAPAAQPESEAAAAGPAHSVSQPSTTTMPAATADHRASSASATARTHGYRRPSARARDEQSPTENDVPAAASNKKPAPANRAGANEVQMF